MSKLKIGLFFDGTTCNAYNTLHAKPANLGLAQESVNERIELGEEAGGDAALFAQQVKSQTSVPNSYLTSKLTSSLMPLTNVYYLQQAYPQGKTEDGYQVSIYINGVGTKDGEQDDLVSSSTGWSLIVGSGQKRGVIDKTDDAINYIETQLATVPNLQNTVYDSVEFEIFGFSRGSTCARHFANRVKNKDKALAAVFKKFFTSKNYPAINSLPTGKTRVMGLYDSVAAILALSQGDLDVNDSNTGDINIEMAKGITDHAFHITAAHEHRYNFSLNRILPDYLSELELPGTHTDIGGSYDDNMTETLFISKPFVTEANQNTKNTDTESYKQAKAVLDLWLNHPLWGNIMQAANVQIYSWSQKASGSSMKFGNIVKMHREGIKTGLSRVGLHAMHRYAISKGCKFDALSATNLAVPADLQNLATLAYSAVDKISAGQPFMSVASQISATQAQKYVHCPAFWAEFSQNIDNKDISDKDIPKDYLWNVLLTSRPTDNLIRSEYDSFGNTLKR